MTFGEEQTVRHYDEAWNTNWLWIEAERRITSECHNSIILLQCRYQLLKKKCPPLSAHAGGKRRRETLGQTLLDFTLGVEWKPGNDLYCRKVLGHREYVGYNSTAQLKFHTPITTASRKEWRCTTSWFTSKLVGSKRWFYNACSKVLKSQDMQAISHNLTTYNSSLSKFSYTWCSK